MAIQKTREQKRGEYVKKRRIKFLKLKRTKNGLLNHYRNKEGIVVKKKIIKKEPIITFVKPVKKSFYQKVVEFIKKLIK